MIDGVILGLRTDPEDEEAIRGWIEKQAAATELLRIRHLPNYFRLDAAPA